MAEHAYSGLDNNSRTPLTNEAFSATAWNNGQCNVSGAGYGLKVSVADRDRFFRRDWRSVTLRLVAKSGSVDVQVNCAKDSFWNGTCRELIARKIGRWFLNLGLAPWPKGRPPRFELAPVEPGVFRVEPRTHGD